jgi:adenine-specific DNA-methyltransferase
LIFNKKADILKKGYKLANFFNILETILRQDGRFFSKDDNTLLRNKVYELAVNMDTNLIKMLLSNPETKDRFFKEIDGILVFDKIEFGWVINNQQLLPDSYTSFKNRIGLANPHRDLISASDDVVLTFPYKDCILAGGQTKEEQKRNEIFYNTLLAPDEVDRLLYPKVLSGSKRYTAELKGTGAGTKRGTGIGAGTGSGSGTADGKGSGAGVNAQIIEENITFNDNDNLIINGNNLLSLACFQKKYAKKIKLIYADPPYNTGGDANIFSYNNTFNHSTWLTFMKNRLELSKQLLRNDGFIVLAIDHVELFYLGVIADEIFGRENFISTITVQHNPKGRNQAKFFSSNSDFLLVYAKDKSQANFYPVAIDEEVKQTFTEQDAEGLFRWSPYLRARTVWSREARPENWYPIYVSKDLKTITSTKIQDAHELFPKTNSGDFAWKNVKSTFDELNHDGYYRAIEVEKKIIIEHKYREQQVLKNVWIDKKYQSEFNGHNLLKELIGENKFSYPKSLYAVLDIIKIMTASDDIILDFFGGSGTTAHAVIEANKEQGYNRKFILCEQLDEHIDIIQKRMKAIFTNYDNIIPLSYVYCELAKCNQTFIDETIKAQKDDELIEILERIKETGFISFKIDPDLLNETKEDFKNLPIEAKKQFIIDLLDKNMLYVNLCDIEDEDYKISVSDKAFNKSFYNMEGIL